MDGPTFTKNNEGCTLVSIKDTEGWEIGWGHNTPAIVQGMTWTQDEADQQFELDYAEAVTIAQTVLGVPYWNVLSAARQAALTDMAYEMGQQRLSKFGQMLQAIRNQNWQGAQAQCLNSVYASEVPGRAKKVAALLFSGVWPN